MEFPLFNKKWKKGTHVMDFVYPNKYHGGIYSLAVHIFYNLVNSREKWVLNRVFLDKGKIQNGFIGFSLQYEPDYYNVFNMLRKAGIPLKRKDREQIVFAGGPCVNTNPRSIEKYFDFLVIGSAELVTEKVLDIYEKDQEKDSFLKKISKLPGIYVPGISKEVKYNFLDNPNKIPYPLYQPMPKQMDEKFVFGNCFILEIERGCPFKCGFCIMPFLFSQVKYRSLESIKEIIDQGLKINKRKKVVIYTPSFSHPKRKEILKHIISKGATFSIPSVKAELADDELLSLIRKGGQKSLTLAPECNESLRKKLNKLTTDEQFFKVIDLANKHGFKKMKYYFMTNLPSMTEKDLQETVSLIEELKRRFKGKSYFSINATIPKPNTAFANHTFDKKTIKSQRKYLEKELKKLKVRYKFNSTRASEKEYLLANAKQVSTSPQMQR